jgi:hypothetical protein
VQLSRRGQDEGVLCLAALRSGAHFMMAHLWWRLDPSGKKCQTRLRHTRSVSDELTFLR